MNERRQLRVLFREFLFRLVDRELLSSHAKGDASQLLLQILTLLIGVSVLVSLPALFLDPGQNLAVRLSFAWKVEHFLIATTMLAVGVFAVLGWGSMFPDRRDVLVLGPLPVRPHTILLAKIGALATALGAGVVALHLAASVVWPMWLNATSRSFPIPAMTFEPALPPVGAADLQAVLDRDFARAVQTGPLVPSSAQGVSIAVSTRGTERVFTYGAATPDSLFPVASVTKTFTGLALAHLIEQGIARGDEPVRELIPAARLVRPAFGRGEITLFDLVTHQSGLRDAPAGVRQRAPETPYAEFDVDRLYAWLAARGVGRSSDPGFRYSNLGFGLLGHALATRAGVDYDTLVRQLIAGPLGMTDTAVALTPDQQRRLLPGHDREYQPVAAWEIPAVLAGAGALKSSARDLLAFVEANLHPDRLPAGTLANALRASHQRLAAAGPDIGLAFAWGITPNGEFAHAGGMAGYSSFVSFDSARDRAIVVLANTSPHTSVSANVIAQHVRARLDGEPALAIADVTIPAQSGLFGWLRLFAAYWATMMAAALFVFALTIALQGLAAALLPHRVFLRVSSILQLGVFCAVVGGYFLQPMIVHTAALMEAQAAPFFQSSPSYWFLGLFQTISGSPALAPLAARALVASSLAALIAAGVCALSYMRTLRRLAETPDIAPAAHRALRLPRVGSPLHTAIVHFAARTLVRSGPHRVIFTFYLGLGFALAAVLLKAPLAAELTDDLPLANRADASMPLIVSSVVMMVCAIVGARLTFAMPRELAANWIFRVLPLRGGSKYLAARRRALVVLAAAPVWLVSAGVFFALWPWAPALGHLVILALVGAILVELCVSGTQGIPFTCAYLPGQSRSHISAPAAVIVLLLFMTVIADAEQRALEEPWRYAVIIAVLAVVLMGARWRASWQAEDVPPEFEGEPADRALSLELWDTR